MAVPFPSSQGFLLVSASCKQLLRALTKQEALVPLHASVYSRQEVRRAPGALLHFRAAGKHLGQLSRREAVSGSVPTLLFALA